MRNEADVFTAIETYADTVRRVCFMRLKNYADVEDIFQDVFMKYALYDKEFANEDHKKAWFIRVSINACNDLLKSFFRKKVTSIDHLTIEPSIFENTDKELWNEVFKLHQNYRDVIYLFYYEGYSAIEIAKILNKKENTIYTWLSRAKKQLKTTLGGDFNG